MSAPIPPSTGTSTARAPRNRRGLLALVLGVVALVLAFVPYASYGAWLIGLAAVVLGVLAILRPGSAKRAGIAGIALGALAVVVSVVMSIVYTLLFALAAASGSAASAGAAAHRVVYSVTGEGSATAIAVYTVAGGRSGQSTLQDQDLPWSRTVTARGDLTGATTVLTVVGQRAGSGAIGCSITLDGKVVAEETGDGTNASVQCVYRPAG